MIVLPEDPLSISPDKLLALKVDMTIVGGRILYDRSEPRP
jgi:predicted amidohydrolase YtcJ